MNVSEKRESSHQPLEFTPISSSKKRLGIYLKGSVNPTLMNRIKAIVAICLLSPLLSNKQIGEMSLEMKLKYQQLKVVQKKESSIDIFNLLNQGITNFGIEKKFKEAFQLSDEQYNQLKEKYAELKELFSSDAIQTSLLSSAPHLKSEDLKTLIKHFELTSLKGKKPAAKAREKEKSRDVTYPRSIDPSNPHAAFGLPKETYDRFLALFTSSVNLFGYERAVQNIKNSVELYRPINNRDVKKQLSDHFIEKMKKIATVSIELNDEEDDPLT